MLVLLKNRYETTVVYWACQSLGVVFTPLNWRARAAEVTFCLEDSDAKAVAFEEASMDSVREALAQCGREGLPRIIVAAGRSESGEVPYTALAESEPLGTWAAVPPSLVSAKMLPSPPPPSAVKRPMRVNWLREPTPLSK